jgi:integrase/recombinase XerD
MTTTTLETCLSSSINRYVELKQSLGRQFTNERRVLELLNEFVADIGAADFTLTVFERWDKTQTHLAPSTRRNRMQFVRSFCLYRRRMEPQCFVPDQSIFTEPNQTIRPHIFSDAEMVRLLEAAARLPAVSTSPLRPEVFRLAIVLLYCTGIRRRELERLTLADYDRREHTLLIRESKFYKSRYVPLAADAFRELETYLATRKRCHLPVLVDSPLLWNSYAHGRPYSGYGLWNGIRELLRSTGVRKADGTLPRVHDMRHNFALQTLLRWYRSGIDVQAKLPLLSLYMGHVSIKSTEYYLPFIPELARAASNQFCSRYGALVQPLSPGGVS